MAEKNRDLIWITEAMVLYKHSRNWFNRRLDSKILKEYPQPGEVKVYLSKREIEAEVKKGGR